MPFTFKLSKRLAHSRARLVILVAAAALACEHSDPSFLSQPTDTHVPFRRISRTSRLRRGAGTTTPA